eukprot:8327967-Prorocentrum_lima.AAC.1
MVECFDQEMRDGNSPNALVVDGCALYGRLRHPIGDKYHFLLEPENIARIDNFVSESVQLLQMLFWNNKALVVNNEFQNDPDVIEISHKRVMRKRVFYRATSTCIIAPPFHP